MPQPPSPVETLQGIIRKWFNREIREYFSDLNIDDNFDPDLTTPRAALASALRHQDNDSLVLTLLKCWFFEYIKGQIYRVPYFGIPVTSFQEVRRYQPQVKLYFLEDFEDVEPGYSPVAGEITFRIMGPDAQNITPARAEVLAGRVKAVFNEGGRGYVWRKGKDMATYTDWAQGYQLQLFTRSPTEARELITKVLDIQNHTPKWSKLNYAENAEPMEAYPTVPEKEMVYGELRREPRKRPIADCRIQYALLNLHGVPVPIVLYDRSYTYSTALVTSI